jgi:hypothetical protein
MTDVTRFSERKIDRIEERLASLESMLKSVVCMRSQVNPAPSNSAQVEVTVRPRPSKQAVSFASTKKNDSTRAFEGDSSLTAHSLQASDFLSTAVQHERFRDNPEMHAALQSLHGIVSRQHMISVNQEALFSSSKGLEDFSATNSLSLPPVDVVLPCISKVEGEWLVSDSRSQAMLPRPGPRR